MWIIIFLIDQGFKYLAQRYLQTNIELFGPVFLTYAENYGIAFGIEFPSQLLLILTFIIISYFFYLFYIQSPHYKYTRALILGGAISNFFDRAYLGYVVDYLYLPLFQILNFADICITLGILFYMYKAVQEELKLRKASLNKLK